MNKKIFFAVMIVLEMFLISCASSPEFKGTATLTGLIVDELNQPVIEFPVSVSVDNIKYGMSITNKSGVFVFHNLPSGNAEFSGKKDGYTVLKCKEKFFHRDKVFCFQILSADIALDKVDEKLCQKDMDDALAILKTIYAKQNSVVAEVLHSYKKSIRTYKNEMKAQDKILEKKEIEEDDV